VKWSKVNKKFSKKTQSVGSSMALVNDQLLIKIILLDIVLATSIKNGFISTETNK